MFIYLYFNLNIFVFYSITPIIYIFSIGCIIYNIILLSSLLAAAAAAAAAAVASAAAAVAAAVVCVSVIYSCERRQRTDLNNRTKYKKRRAEFVCQCMQI